MHITFLRTCTTPHSQIENTTLSEAVHSATWERPSPPWNEFTEARQSSSRNRLLHYPIHVVPTNRQNSPLYKFDPPKGHHEIVVVTNLVGHA